MADETLMTEDDPSVSAKTATPTYGLFLVDDDGSPQAVFTGNIAPDSFLSYDFSNDSRISQYPQEAGGFQQYNKVDTPFDLRIALTKGGKTSDIAQFIEKAEGLAKATDLNLYTVITPERTYDSVNVQKVSHMHKREHGANMVTVEISLLQIRVSGSAQYANTDQTLSLITDSKSPTSQSPQSAGTVQPGTPATATVASVNDAIVKAQLDVDHTQMTH